MLREAEEAEHKDEWETVWKLKDDALRLLLDAATEPDKATLRSLAGLWLLRNIEIPRDCPHGHAHKTFSAAELRGMLEKYVLEDWGWHNELYPLVTANFDRFQEQLLTFADTLPGDVLAVVMDAGYMFFDDIETHYVVGDAFSEDELCLYGCNHMG